MQHLSKERIQNIANSLPARTTLQMPRGLINEVCRYASPKEKWFSTSTTDCSRTVTQPRLFRRRRRNALHFMSHPASSIQEIDSVAAGAHCSEAEYAPTRMLRCNHFGQGDMITAWSRSPQTYGTCGQNRETPMQHRERPRSGVSNLSSPAKYLASSDETCPAVQTKAKSSDRRRQRQQNNSLRAAKETIATEVRHSRGRDEQEGRIDAKIEETVPSAGSYTCETMTAGGKDGGTQKEVPITHTAAVKRISPKDALQVRLQPKEGAEALEQAGAQDKSSTTHGVAWQEKTTASEATVLQSPESLFNAPARNMRATPNPTKTLRRTQSRRSQKCINGEKQHTVEAIRPDALEAPVEVLCEAFPSPRTHKPADTLDADGGATFLRENVVLAKQNHFTMVEGVPSGEKATSSVCACPAPSSTPGPQTSKQSTVIQRALSTAAVCSLCYKAETTTLEVSCSHVTTSTRRLTRTADSEVGASLSPHSPSIKRKKTDGREGEHSSFLRRRLLHVGSAATIGAHSGASFSERRALLNSAAGGTPERAVDDKCSRDNDRFKQWCTTPFMSLTQTASASKVTPAAAGLGSGSSTFFKRPSTAPLPLLGCTRPLRLLLTGSSRQASIRDATYVHGTTAISRDTTACDESSKWHSVEESQATSLPWEMSLCCCCDCCCSSIVITTATQLSTDQGLAPLYPVPPPPRKFYDRQGNRLSGKPGWYGHNYPSFRSTRIQQCGLLYLKWQRGHLRVGTVVLLLLKKAVKLLFFVIKRAASSTFHTVHEPARPSARQMQCFSNTSTGRLPVSANSIVQEEPQLLDQLLDGRSVQRQQQLLHVCALPYCKGTNPLQRDTACRCNVNLRRRKEVASYTPVGFARGDPPTPEGFQREFCNVRRRGTTAGEARRRKSNTRLPSASITFQRLPLDDTDGAPRETRWNTDEEDCKALLRSSTLLKQGAQETVHREEKDGQDKVSVETDAVQRGIWLHVEGAAEADLLVKNRNKRERAYRRRATHKTPQEAAAVADLLPKVSCPPDGFFHSCGHALHTVGPKEESIVLVDHGTAEGNLSVRKVKRREGDTNLLSSFRRRMDTGGTFSFFLLGLLVPRWLQAPVTSLLLQLTTHLALLRRSGLLQCRVSPLLKLLLQLLVEGPKELLVCLVPTFVADIFKIVAKEWESLGVPDSEARRRLKFTILLLIMYPFVHGFYIPCLVLLWLVRRAYDALWRFCATSCCSYCTSKQELRRWQDQVHKQQLNLQEQQSSQQQSQCTAQRVERDVVICRDEQQNRLQKLVSISRRRQQGKQGTPAVQVFQQSGVQQDDPKHSSEQRQYQGRHLKRIEQQRQLSSHGSGKERGIAKHSLHQQFQPPRRGWHVAWSQLQLLPVCLTKFFHGRKQDARSPTARKKKACSNQGSAAAQNMTGQSYSLQCSIIYVLRERLNSCVILRTWNAFCFLISLPFRYIFAFFNSRIARYFSLNLWARSTAAAVGGKAKFLHFLRRPNKAARSCKSRYDACSKDKSAKCHVLLLLRNIFLVNPLKTPLLISTFVRGKIVAGKKAHLCGVPGWTTKDSFGRRAVTLLKAGFYAVSGFKQRDRGKASQREKEILGLLNGQELVLFSQPHMVVCGVGYTEKLTREELLEVVRKKLLVQRDVEATQHEQQTREENDDGLTHRQKISEKRARKKATGWKAERTGEREREADKDVTNEHSDEQGWSDKFSPVRKTGMEEGDEEEETLKHRTRKGNENQWWERNASENNSDEDSTVPLLRFKHPRLRTSVKKVLNRYCWVRDENFSAARHVISLNRQQVLTLLELHQGQHSPADFMAFTQNLARREAGSRVHSISCCQRCSRNNVPDEKDTEKRTKIEMSCKNRIPGREEWEGTAEQREEERVSGKNVCDGKKKERPLNTPRDLHRAAESAQPSRSKQQLKRKRKETPAAAGGKTNLPVDQLNSSWNRMAVHTHCSGSMCAKQDKMFFSDRIPSNGCRSSTSTSEQRVEERVFIRANFRGYDSGETGARGDILSPTGARPHNSSEEFTEEESVRGISKRSGRDTRIRNKDKGGFSPRHTLAFSSRSTRSNPNGSEQKEKDGRGSQVFSFSRRSDSEERARDGLSSKDVFVSQVSSGCPTEREQGSSREKECRCIVRKEEAQALLTLLASQTLPPELPLWQFVLLESVEIPQAGPAASDVAVSGEGKRNSSSQKRRHKWCSAVTSSIEGTAAEEHYRINHRSADEENRSIEYKGDARKSTGKGKAKAVQRSQTTPASSDRGSERKRGSSIRAGQSVQSSTTTRVNCTTTNSPLMETSANVKNTMKREGVLFRKRRSFGVRREERDSWGVPRTACLKHGAEKWRKVVTTSDVSTLRKTADSGGEEICCLQTETGDRREEEATNRQSTCGWTRKPVVRSKPRETGGCVAESSGGVEKLKKGGLSNSEEPRIGSMIIFRVHHSVADGIALTNMFLSDVFTASPIKQRSLCPLIEHNRSSLPLSAAQKYGLSAAPYRASVSALNREEEIQTEQTQHSGIKEGSNGVGELEEESKENRKWSRYVGCSAEGQEQTATMRPKMLQPELPSFTPSTTAASSPASRGQRLDGDSLGRCCTGPLIQRDPNGRGVGADVVATGSAADATGCAADPSSFPAVPTVSSPAVPSTCSQSRGEVGVSTPVAADAARTGILAGSAPSPATTSEIDSSRHLISSFCSASDSLMTTGSVRPVVNTVQRPEALLVFSTEEHPLLEDCHHKPSLFHTEDIFCPSKSARCHSRTETSSMTEPASHSRFGSEDVAPAHAVFTAKAENKAASAAGPIKPMVPPITPPSLLPRLLMQVIAYLRIPWEVCSLLVLRRDRSWDSVVQPRRQRAGWAHEVHWIRFDLQELRKLRRCLSTAAVGNFKKPVQPPAAFLCRHSAPLPYIHVLRMLQRAVPVASSHLLCLQQQLFMNSLIKSRRSAKPFLSATRGCPTQPSSLANSAAVAGDTSAKTADAAFERQGKRDAAALLKSVVAPLDATSVAGHCTPAATAFLCVLLKSTAALITFSVGALQRAAEVVGEFLSSCLKRRRCRNLSASNSTSCSLSATIFPASKAAYGTSASNSAATANSFTINELLTSCVAGGVSRYIGAMTAREHLGGATAQTQKQNAVNSSGRTERFYQPTRVSLTSASAQASTIARLYERRHAPKWRHAKLPKNQHSSSLTQRKDIRRSTTASCSSDLPERLLIDEAVSVATRAIPGRDSGTIRRRRCRSISSTWDYQRKQPDFCRETCRRWVKYEDAPALAAAHHMAPPCARRTSPSRFTNSGAGNNNVSDTTLLFRKCEAHGETATCTDGGANAQRCGISAATSSSDALCPMAADLDSFHEANRINGGYVFPRSTHNGTVSHTTETCSSYAAGPAWARATVLGRRDGVRIARAQAPVPKVSPKKLLSQRRSQSSASLKMATSSITWNLSGKRQHRDMETLTDVQGIFRGTCPIAEIISLGKESEAAEARTTTAMPTFPLADVNTTLDDRRCIVAFYTDKKWPANESNCVEQPLQLTTNGKEYTCAGRRIRPFDFETRHGGTPAATTPAAKTVESERENNKTAKAEGLQQIQKSLLDLNIVVPVNLRTTEEESFQLHNNFTSVVVQLAIADLFFADTAYERLVKVRAKLRKSVKSAGASVFGLMEKICFATTPDFTWFLHMWLTNKLSMLFSNVPGPSVLPQIHGRQVYMMNFIGSLVGKVGINVSAFSYANSLDLVLHIDRAVLSSPELLRQCILDEYQELEQLCICSYSRSRLNATKTDGGNPEVLERKG